MAHFIQFDPEPVAVINPGDVHARVEGFPEIVVSTFARSLVEKFVEHYGAKQFDVVEGANGSVPVYGVEYKNTKIALYLSPVGGPAAAGFMEELIAKGGRRFMVFGSCGVLRADIAEGHFVVPYAAVRDEGTSYHYLPAAPEVALPPACVQAVSDTLQSMGLAHVTAKTWTTDAIYRETRDKVRQQVAAGCAVVEMECAAMAAVAQFRGVSFGQFLFADDNLDAPEWERRTLGENGVRYADRYMAAALECGLHLPAVPREKE